MLRKMNFKSGVFAVWVALLLGVMAVGAYAAVLVFTKGLAVTNLTDQVPWGERRRVLPLSIGVHRRDQAV
jgi:Ni/Fe-hydrogenase subunit HybB-like protein